MTNEQKDQVIALLRNVQIKRDKYTRDYERGYLEGALVGIEKVCEALGCIVKFNPIDDEWSIEEK